MINDKRTKQLVFKGLSFCYLKTISAYMRYSLIRIKMDDFYSLPLAMNIIYSINCNMMSVKFVFQIVAELFKEKCKVEMTLRDNFRFWLTSVRQFCSMGFLWLAISNQETYPLSFIVFIYIPGIFSELRS